MKREKEKKKKKKVRHSLKWQRRLIDSGRFRERVKGQLLKSEKRVDITGVSDSLGHFVFF